MPDGIAAPPERVTKLLLDVVEVAGVLGCGRTHVYELISRGELRPVKLGRLTRFTPATVEEFVRRKAAAAGCERP